MFALNSVVILSAILLAASASPVNPGLTRADCTITQFDQVSSVVSSCTDIVINGLTVPGGKQLALNLKSGSTLTFKGTTKFEHGAWDGPMVLVKGSKVVVKADSSAVLDGQGAAYWDGLGGSGSTKPKFFRVSTTGGSTVKDIKLKNCPKQCVSINSASDTLMEDWVIDVSDGDKNSVSVSEFYLN